MRQLISLQVGTPQQHLSALADGEAAAWTSAIFKASVAGRIPLDRLNLAGDGQADLKNHGGVDKAVCCYPAEHYPPWRDLLGMNAKSFPYGAFGENFTLAEMPEDAVCIGDIYSVGTAIVQISQPRMPCYKMGRRWNIAHLPTSAVQSGRTGYYLRVLQTGAVAASDTLAILSRPLPDWTVARVNNAMYVRKDDAALAAELADLDLLAEAWRSMVRRRASFTQR